MPGPTRALVIGRFQPPHRGHLHCFESAARHADRFVVAIGSAQRSHTLRDPFTAGERIELVQAALHDVDLEAEHIIPVPDLDQYHLWVAQVAAFAPRFDLVVAGNPMTLRLFSDAGHQVEAVDVEDRERLSGTEVRRRLTAEEPVTDLVTPGVAAWLGRDDVKARLRALRGAATETQG